MKWVRQRSAERAREVFTHDSNTVFPQQRVRLGNRCQTRFGPPAAAGFAGSVHGPDENAAAGRRSSPDAAQITRYSQRPLRPHAGMPSIGARSIPAYSGSFDSPISHSGRLVTVEGVGPQGHPAPSPEKSPGEGVRMQRFLTSEFFADHAQGTPGIIRASTAGI